jgi:hypothetical protein
MGYTITVAGGPVVWTSRPQKRRALSTPEAELLAVTECARELEYLRNLTSELGLQLQAPAYNLHCDNAAVTNITSSGRTWRMRHLAISELFSIESQKRGTIKVIYTPTAEQPADMLTKPLQQSRISHFRNLLSIHPTTTTSTS